jgi:hypothetical protein
MDWMSRHPLIALLFGLGMFVAMVLIGAYVRRVERGESTPARHRRGQRDPIDDPRGTHAGGLGADEASAIARRPAAAVPDTADGRVAAAAAAPGPPPAMPRTTPVPAAGGVAHGVPATEPSADPTDDSTRSASGVAMSPSSKRQAGQKSGRKGGKGRAGTRRHDADSHERQKSLFPPT